MSNPFIRQPSFIVYITLFSMLLLSNSLRPTSALLRNRGLWFRKLQAYSTNSDLKISHYEDSMITCLNGAQDISVKVISCTNILQETIDRLSLSQQAAQGYGELLVGATLMASNMKGDEVLQVNLVGGNGIQSLLVVVDSQLRTKGKVGNAKFTVGNGNDKLSALDLVGPGQLQVIKNHPVWKQPVTGIVNIRDVPISINLALYMTESEQRLAAILSDVEVRDGKCQYAVGIMVERLPGATDENVELSINNLETVTKKGIRAYIDSASGCESVDEDVLHRIVDDCVVGMTQDSIRWHRKPTFHCSCGIDRVWGMLKLLPSSDISEIVHDGKGVEVKCEFCAQKYNLTSQEVADEFHVKSQ